MSDPTVPPGGPISPPPGAEVVAATPRSLTLRTPQAVPEGRLMEFELLLGARPLEAVGRVVSAGADPQGGWRVDLELVAVAQVERDVLADFLQAVGAGSLRIRARRD